MSNNADLISKWLTAYQQLDYSAMADCYHDQATFQDIAFDLTGKQQIGSMWHMICKNGIDISIDDPPKPASDEVVTRITGTYIFSSTKREVVNHITCHFQFRDDLIIEHRDVCDPISWASQAMGGLKGWLAGRLPFLRHWAAEARLREFAADQRQSS